MFRTFTAASLLTIASAMPIQQAAAQDPIAGGIFGGAVGGLLGGAIGGRGGAVAGAIIGGTTGAAIAAQGQPRANGYYWYNNGCYAQRPGAPAPRQARDLVHAARSAGLIPPDPGVRTDGCPSAGRCQRRRRGRRGKAP